MSLRPLCQGAAVTLTPHDEVQQHSDEEGNADNRRADQVV
jgi:hypothetical protein